MTLQELLQGKNPPRKLPGLRGKIRAGLRDSRTKLVVVDDDPTGTQTVHGVRVYMDWSSETLVKAFSAPEPVFYVSTNSRGYGDAEMFELTRVLGRNLRSAEEATGIRPLFSSRSDSTLRGHFPREIEALLSGYGGNVDGVILAPAFFEAGRYTVNDIHWVEQAGVLVPASETEFAKDPTFGYRNGDLAKWVEEKTKGAWKANQVLSVPLEALRDDDGKAAVDILLGASGGVPVILNAACYEDLEAAVTAIVEAEARGKRFAYRSAACFVKVRGGFEDIPLLTPADVECERGPGLVVVGSYVGKTTRQLERLLQGGKAEAVELKVEEVRKPDGREAEKARVVKAAENLLKAGRTAAVHTSRTVEQATSEEFLAFGNLLMQSLCEVVQDIGVRPSFFVAKGGITSVELARTGLGVKEALVRGQIDKGIALWKLGPEAKWPGLPYVVFPGNVGTDETLRGAVEFFCP